MDPWNIDGVFLPSVASAPSRYIGTERICTVLLLNQELEFPHPAPDGPSGTTGLGRRTIRMKKENYSREEKKAGFAQVPSQRKKGGNGCITFKYQGCLLQGSLDSIWKSQSSQAPPPGFGWAGNMRLMMQGTRGSALHPVPCTAVQGSFRHEVRVHTWYLVPVLRPPPHLVLVLFASCRKVCC